MKFVKNLWSIKRISLFLLFSAFSVHDVSVQCIAGTSFKSIILLQFWKLRALFSNQICKSRFICSNYSYTSSACVCIQIAVRFACSCGYSCYRSHFCWSWLFIIHDWRNVVHGTRAHFKVIICNINCLHARRRQTTTTPSTIHLIIHWFEIPLVCITPHLLLLLLVLLL